LIEEAIGFHGARFAVFHQSSRLRVHQITRGILLYLSAYGDDSSTLRVWGLALGCRSFVADRLSFRRI
jgi:hypothetical protein